MSVGATRPLGLTRFHFGRLYRRHLGRHSQWGINAAHLLALYGVWFGIYGTIIQVGRLLGMPAAWPVVAALAVSYVAVVAIAAPPAVTILTALFMTLFGASLLALPPLPAWSIAAFLALIPVCYKIQAYSHKVWNVTDDMSPHLREFPPGRDLNLILLFHEVPICLNYLVFHPRDWRR